MSYKKPLLSTYEFYTLTSKATFSTENYPMDFYSDKGGEWSNYFHRKRDKKNRGIKLKRKKKTAKIEVEVEEKVEENIDSTKVVVNDETVDF